MEAFANRVSILLEAFRPLSEFFTWPIVALILGLVFRGSISALISRIRKFGRSGVEFDLQQGPSISSDTLRASQPRFEDLPLTDPAAIEIEGKFWSALEDFEPDRREKVLIRALVNTQLERSFALAYAGVFGAQIKALELMNSGPIRRDQAEQFFQELQEQDHFYQGVSIEEFMQYLKNWKFGDEVGGQYEITETGRAFLRFIVNAGLSKYRPH